MVKQEKVTELLTTFKKEIDVLLKKKHKTEDDLLRLNNSLVLLEKQQDRLNQMVANLMNKGSRIGSKRMRTKDKLDKTSEKLAKLKMLYEDLKEIK